ncbi:MAG: hypothetical protein IH852_04665 [Bacteroidetes bacterium]|nr:hypothetical protein [Bacteroidota bacterium]
MQKLKLLLMDNSINLRNSMKELMKIRLEAFIAELHKIYNLLGDDTK